MERKHDYSELGSASPRLLQLQLNQASPATPPLLSPTSTFPPQESTASTSSSATTAHSQADLTTHEEDGTRADRCDRKWPKCGRCTGRGLDCQFSNLVPVDFIKTLDQDARVAELESRIHSLESELVAQNYFLPSAADLPSSISSAIMAGAESPEVAIHFMEQVEERQLQKSKPKPKRKFEQRGDDSTSPPLGPGSLSLQVRLEKPALQRSFAIHLLDAWFDSCCASLPVFRPWYERREQLYLQIDNLDPASRVAVATFCALGARSTPHSALLGITESENSDETTTMILSGIRRQQAFKALHIESVELSDRLEICHDPSVKSLEAMMAQMQALIWQELIPRRSRTMVRNALGMFKDLQDGMFDEQERRALVKSLGLPLLVGDAVTSAYARRACLVTDSDLEEYFTGINLPNFDFDNLESMMSVHLKSGQEPNHMSLSIASMVILKWVIACQREFSRIASPRASQFTLISSEVMALWAALDQIHSSIQNFQHMLMSLDRLPGGCEADGCHSMHLRFITRLDREVDDVTWLIHSLLTERDSSFQTRSDEMGSEWIQESERRVRKGLKLAAFYFEALSISISPNQTYYLTWALELMPHWTSLAVQRFGEEGGPISRECELTETELDWIEKGLKVASFYHPVAERRLVEIKAKRRPKREDAFASRATMDRPNLNFDEALKRTVVASVPAWG